MPPWCALSEQPHRGDPIATPEPALAIARLLEQPAASNGGIKRTRKGVRIDLEFAPSPRTAVARLTNSAEASSSASCCASTSTSTRIAWSISKPIARRLARATSWLAIIVASAESDSSPTA